MTAKRESSSTDRNLEQIFYYAEQLFIFTTLKLIKLKYIILQKGLVFVMAEFKWYGHFNADDSYTITEPETPRHWYNYMFNDEYVSFTSQVGFGEAVCQDILRHLPQLPTSSPAAAGASPQGEARE